MSSVLRAGQRLRWWWSVLGMLTLATSGARADQWTIDNTLATRYESNDNINLAPSSPGTVNTLSLSTAFNAARKMENAATLVNANLAALHQQGPGAQDRVDGQLGLSQSLNDALNSFNAAWQYAQDDNNNVATADVTLGHGRRRSQTISASWARSVSERLSVNTQATQQRTGFGGQLASANDYRNTALSIGLSKRLSEVDTVSAQTSHSEYRTLDGSNRSTTDDLSLSLSRSLSERSSASLKLGVYRTQTEQSFSFIACPLLIESCTSHQVPFKLYTDTAQSTARGLEFGLGDVYQLNEATSLSIGVSRQQSPSGAGTVVRSDMLNASASHSFSETLSGTLAYVRSRAQSPGVGAVLEREQQALSLSLSKQLATNLSLQSGYQLTRLSVPGARSNNVSISLQYNWPKVDATH